jgi:hypothetical protein
MATPEIMNDAQLHDGNAHHRRKSSGVIEVSGPDGQRRTLNLAEMNDADAQLAAQFGYKPVFKREFGYLSTFSFAVSISGLFATIMTTFSFPLYAGGSAAAVWCWLISGAGCMCIAVSESPRAIGELFLIDNVKVLCRRACLCISHVWRIVCTPQSPSAPMSNILRYFTISRLAPREWVPSLSW